MIIDFPWYFVLLCLLAGAIYAAALYFLGRSSMPRRLRLALAALRFAAVSLVAFLLLAPMNRQHITERQLPHVVLVQDVSQSVALGADSTFSLDAVAASLEGHCRVSRETVGSANATDLGAPLEHHRGDNVAALVLASDGIHNRGTNPTTIAEKLSFPVHCIALGDTTPRRDALLTSLRCNRIAMLGNDFPVEVTVAASLLAGKTSRLVASDANGRQLITQPVAYTTDDFSTTLSFSLNATEPGLQRFKLLLSPVDGESIQSNNTVTFYVDVIDSRQHVAIFANAPHPDLAALKLTIESNPNYEADIVLAEEVENGRWKADKDYSLAILHNLPSQRHPSLSFADGLPQLFIIGLQTDLPRFNALHTGLEITARSARTNEVTAIFQPSFALFSLDADDATILEALPPLSAPFGEARQSQAVQTLFGARLASIDTRQPLVAATAQGEQRRAFVWGEGLWRWRLADYQLHQSHRHLEQLVWQLVSFTALQTHRDRLQVDADRSYAEGEPVVIRAQVYNEAYQLTSTPEVKLQLSGDSIAHSEYLFQPTGNSYTLSLPPLKEGLYRYKASTADFEASGTFAVEALNLEQHRLTADHGLLATVASLSDGHLYHPDQMSALVSQLSALKPTLYSRTRYADMMRMPLVLSLIVLLLAAEWVLRKYHGTI